MSNTPLLFILVRSVIRIQMLHLSNRGKLLRHDVTTQQISESPQRRTTKIHLSTAFIQRKVIYCPFMQQAAHRPAGCGWCRSHLHKQSMFTDYNSSTGINEYCQYVKFFFSSFDDSDLCPLRALTKKFCYVSSISRLIKLVAIIS
jgi:hypothetical protein